MKLSEIKEKQIFKNNQLPENQRWTSSVRKEYKKKSDVQNNQEFIGLKSLENNKDATMYSQSDLSGLNKLNDYSNLEEFNNLPNFFDNKFNLDNVKVIGITGSRGKSTTSFIVQEYIKAYGKKSILYSSIRIDSPVNHVNVNEPCEIPILNEHTIIDIIDEIECYEADYIVMEINESTIEKGFTKDIPFFVRALTNIDPNHNLELYSSSDYVKLKEEFFKNIPEGEDCTCVLGLTGAFSRDDFNRFLKLNNNPKITFGSDYVCKARNADYTNLDILLFGMESDINGLDLKIRVKDKVNTFKTNLIFTHNAFNITCAISIIEALGIFDANIFNKCISNITIPGREEIIRVKDRTIMIGLSLIPALENFKEIKEISNINKIKVVIGSTGTGFVSWSKEFSSELFLSKRSSSRQFAMNYLKNNADYAYLTSNDNAAEDPFTIAKELEGYLNNEIPSEIIVDRVEAIRKAIIDSKPNDLIYIAGRGNRRLFCDSKNTVKLIQDKEIVEKVLGELGW